MSLGGRLIAALSVGVPLVIVAIAVFFFFCYRKLIMDKKDSKDMHTTIGFTQTETNNFHRHKSFHSDSKNIQTFCMTTYSSHASGVETRLKSQSSSENESFYANGDESCSQSLSSMLNGLSHANRCESSSQCKSSAENDLSYENKDECRLQSPFMSETNYDSRDCPQQNLTNVQNTFIRTDSSNEKVNITRSRYTFEFDRFEILHFYDTISSEIDIRHCKKRTIPHVHSPLIENVGLADDGGGANPNAPGPIQWPPAPPPPDLLDE